MKLHLHNSLTRRLEEFIPIDSKEIKMYVCGPTVYDHIHLGNARSIVIFDVLFRILRENYQKVTYVRNITDLDDKINARAKELGINLSQLTDDTTRFFHEDCDYLLCLKPTFEPKATEHITEMLKIIEYIMQNGYAYHKGEHIYFDLAAFLKNNPDKYSQLSGRKIADLIPNIRIEPDLQKSFIGDFILWKQVESDTPNQNKYIDSALFDGGPWGRGKPGWHLECSAMSHHYLGDEFDIHGGGIDLIFPHHTNEIAQNIAAFNKTNPARYWIHNGLITVNKNKMSKSLNNFTTVQSLRTDGLSGEALRYFLISSHYRKELDFSIKALNDCKSNLEYLYRAIELLNEDTDHHNQKINPDFLAYLNNDLNTSAALAQLLSIAKLIHKTSILEDKIELAQQLKLQANLLGILNLTTKQWNENKNKDLTDPKSVEELMKDRNIARQNQNYRAADEIRKELLEKHSIVLEDRGDMTVWHKK